MTTDAAVHLVPNGGAPQTEPGRWPTRLAELGLLRWLTVRGRTYCDTWHQATNDHMCKGCLARQRTIGGWVIPHKPAPPQFHWCPYCAEPLDEPSYTNAGHPWCGEGDGDEGYGE